MVSPIGLRCQHLPEVYDALSEDKSKGEDEIGDLGPGCYHCGDGNIQIRAYSDIYMLL